MDSQHTSVLLHEAVDALDIQEGGVYFDGTFGRGGHSRYILEQLNNTGLLLATDKDPEAIEAAQLAPFNVANFTVLQQSFHQIKSICSDQQVAGKVNGVLLDLGVSSPQIDKDERGFSFINDGPLDMRMDPGSGPSAAAWLSDVEEADLIAVLRQYGEERFAKRIARAIVTARAIEPIKSTLQLAKIVSDANPAWEKHKHPATRTFQAIRIAVNQELQALEALLHDVTDVLAPGGRLVIISFHSLEDRMVKQFIRDKVRGDYFPKGLPVTEDMIRPTYKKVGKAIKPCAEEVERNSRARSAVMRIAQKLG